MVRSVEKIDGVLDEFDRRYRNKKLLNLLISLVIIVTGVMSVAYIWVFDGDGILTFRWMTVDGTLFTVAMTTFYFVVNLAELARKTELTMRPAYFARLSSSVAECIIMIVVLLSQLPFFSEHMHILRYDMFCMHILIPVLTVASFVLNDTPLGRLRPKELLLGTAFVTVYAVIIVALIQTGRITQEYIPYFFLDFDNIGVLYVFGSFVFIYCLAFGLSLGLSKLNKRLYWRWFKNLVA